MLIDIEARTPHAGQLNRNTQLVVEPCGLKITHVQARHDEDDSAAFTKTRLTKTFRS